jgi:phosphoenolpyruvate carboxykinase (GTP)
MLPFIGYNGGDYFQHWIEMAKGTGEGAGDSSKLPKIYYVNWFRRDADGRFLWPGFGENSRVLKWIIERIEGRAAAADTPIGRVPSPDQLDLSGLDVPTGDVTAALAVDVDEWLAELPSIEQWFTKIGDTLPSSMRDELDALKWRLAS